MAIKDLAEAIILQSIEDLWNSHEKKGCMAFFEGEGFHLCAGIAGIDVFHKRRLLNLIGTSVRHRLDCIESVQENTVEYSFSRG